MNPALDIFLRVADYVNRSAEQTLEDFRSRAVKADYQLSPGQKPPSEGGTTTTSTSTSTSTHKGLSTGAIVGIVVGAIGAVAVVGLLFFLIGRSRRRSASEKAAAAAAAASLAQPVVDVGPAPGAYGDHPPPQYYGQGQPVWEQPGKGGLAVPAPPLSPNPSQYNPHTSMYMPGSPDLSRGGHTSWAPSELGGESAVQPQRVEIYTPGVDERIPLNNPPKNP